MLCVQYLAEILTVLFVYYVIVLCNFVSGQRLPLVIGLIYFTYFTYSYNVT